MMDNPMSLDVYVPGTPSAVPASMRCGAMQMIPLKQDTELDDESDDNGPSARQTPAPLPEQIDVETPMSDNTLRKKLSAASVEESHPKPGICSQSQPEHLDLVVPVEERHIVSGRPRPVSQRRRQCLLRGEDAIGEEGHGRIQLIV